MRVRGCGEVHGGVCEDVLAEEREVGDMHGEFSHGEGFLVRLVVGLRFGNALEGFADAGDFHVEVLEEDFCSGHFAGVSYGRDVRAGAKCKRFIG